MSQLILVKTRARGEIAVDPKQIIRFVRGIFGFSDLLDWVLLESKHPPFYWLQSLEDANSAFIVINPYLIFPDYQLNILDDDYQKLLSPKDEDVIALSIVTIKSPSNEITVNLLGPLVVNKSKQIALQSISQDDRWTPRHYVSREQLDNVSIK